MKLHGDVITKALREPVLRRVALGYGGFTFTEHATWLAVLVYAYNRGGVAEAGIIAVVQLIPAVVIAPFAAYAGDRFRPNRALAVGYVVQAATLAATALLLWLDLTIAGYMAAAAAASAVTFTRPVIGALLPVVARSPRDLVAANVVLGFIANLGMMVGPLGAAAVLVVSGPEMVLALGGAVLLMSAALAVGIPVNEDSAASGIEMAVGDLRGEMLAGLRALRHDVTITLVILLLCMGALVAGMVDVLVVAFAEQRLGGGGSEAGVLSAALGFGAILGSGIAAGMIGGTRVVRYLLWSALLLGVPFVALVGSSRLAPSLVLFAVIGMGSSVLVVAGTVALQRVAPTALLARVFGLLEGLQMLALALGSAVLAVLIGTLGLSAGLWTVGVSVIVVMVVLIVAFVQRGGDVAPPPIDLVERLRSDRVFEDLVLRSIERLAFSSYHEEVPAGTAIIREGDDGDRYYLILHGRVRVTRGGTFLREMTDGESFGEIALLNNVARTATVIALEDTSMLVVNRDEFLEAVTGHPRSLAEAHQRADRWLGASPPDAPSP
jgi:hypothetical protein